MRSLWGVRGCVTACGGWLFDVKDLPMPLRGQRKRAERSADEAEHKRVRDPF